MPYARRAGVRLYYEWHGGATPCPGDGRHTTPVVFVRGLSRSLRYWLALADRMAAAWPLLVLDNRGIGRSGDDGLPFRTTTLADDVVAVLDDAGVARAHVFGLSLGGMIAQELVLRHPDRVARLVLGATTSGSRAGHSPSVRSVATLLLANALPRPLAGRLVGPLVLARLAPAERGAILARWAAIAKAEPPSRWTVIRQLVAAQMHDTWEWLASIATPTLCLVGAEERLVPKANTRLLADRIPGARYVEVAGCGHDFPADDTDTTFRLLDSFFQEEDAR